MVKTWDQLEQLQPTVLKMLKNSIRKNRVAHAYLLEGIKGTGKKDLALLITKTLFVMLLLKNTNRVRHAIIAVGLIVGTILMCIR